MKCDQCDFEITEPDKLTAGMLLVAHKAEEHWTERDERVRKANPNEWYGED